MPVQAFLPPDLFDPSRPWVCLGAPGHDLAAPLHDLSFTARSVILCLRPSTRGTQRDTSVLQTTRGTENPALRAHARAGLAADDGCVESAGTAIPGRNRIHAGPEDGPTGQGRAFASYSGHRECSDPPLHRHPEPQPAGIARCRSRATFSTAIGDRTEPHSAFCMRGVGWSPAAAPCSLPELIPNTAAGSGYDCQ